MPDPEPPKELAKALTSEDVCPKCLGELDTGWECTICGYDAIGHKPECDQCKGIGRIQMGSRYVDCPKCGGKLT